MKQKKVLSILLAAVLSIGLLAGCSGGGNDTAADDTPAAQDNAADEGAEDADDADGEDAGSDDSASVDAANKIIVFQSKVEIIDQLEALAKEYQDETGVEVEIWGTTGDDYYQQLKTKLANNQGPTVFSIAPGSEASEMSAYLEDVSDLSFMSSISDDLLQEVDGKIIGVPYTVEGFGMVYNKDLIDLNEVSDDDAFVSMLQDMQDQGINGFGLSQESYFLIGHILNTPFALQDDPSAYIEDLVAGNVKMAETEEFQKFAEMYAAIREYSYNPLSVSYDKECGDFATGQTAAIHQGNWVISMFDDYDVEFEMGLGALPLNGNDKLAVSVPNTWALNSQSTPEEQQAGREFLEWLYTSETGIRYLMDEFQFIPVVEGMENDNLDPLSQEIAEYVEAGKIIGWPNSEWPAGIVDVYLVPVAEEFFTTDMTPEAFLEALDEAFVEAGNN